MYIKMNPNIEPARDIEVDGEKLFAWKAYIERRTKTVKV